MLKPFVVGQLNRFDWPVKGFRVLLGQPFMSSVRPAQFVHGTDVVLRRTPHGGNDGGHVVVATGEVRPLSNGNAELPVLPD